jgi:uracil-DNA glycosylase
MNALAALTFENTFNPYVHCCSVHDLDDAPVRRRDALHAILQVAVNTDVDALWIGRDLGYRGGRRTGLAFTDDVHIHAHAARWGVTISRFTHGQVVSERTASLVWSVISEVKVPIFLWNVFPLHPHNFSQPLSNRYHNANERRAGEEILSALIQLIRPRRLVAVGNDAMYSAKRYTKGQDVVQVRHPSYGGQSNFLRAMQELYSIPEKEVQLKLL